MNANLIQQERYKPAPVIQEMRYKTCRELVDVVHVVLDHCFQSMEVVGYGCESNEQHTYVTTWEQMIEFTKKCGNNVYVYAVVGYKLRGHWNPLTVHILNRTTQSIEEALSNLALT